MVGVDHMLLYDVSDQISQSALHFQTSGETNTVSHIPAWEHGCINIVNDQKAKQQDEIGWHR